MSISIMAGGLTEVEASTRAPAGPNARTRAGDRHEEVREARPSRTAARKAKKRKKRKVCSSRKGKRRCRWVAEFTGHGVSASALRAEPLPRPSGEIWMYAVNFREETKVDIYDQSGELDTGALATLDNIFRCKRTGETRAVDPRLYEILSIIYDHFGQHRIELVSGFRNQRNEGSRHYHASAMDIRIPGVSARELYEFATTLDPGGMGIGIYPTSQFVHVDFRAPGEKSYRWTDHSGPSSDTRRKNRTSGRKRPSS